MRWPRDVRTRLLLIVLVAVSVALVIATIGFNLLLARSNDQSADSLLRQRADSERSLIRVAGGRLVPVETSSDEVGDSRVWLFEGGRTVEAPRARAATDRSRTIAGARPEPVRDRRGHRRAPVLASDRRPRRARRHDRHRRLACPLRAGTSLRALRITRLRNDRPADRGRRRLVAAAVRAPPGGADDGAGRGVERARPRPAVRPRRAARRADTTRLDPRPPARPDRREPASRAPLLGRALARAAYTARQGDGRGRARTAAAA